MCFIWFQSLIGTVQRYKILNELRAAGYTFQSLIGTVQQKKLRPPSDEEIREFQSLIGTVQQQYLLRFLFSLYPIFPVFQPFSPKKSVNLFIVNSRKALILLTFLFLSKLARRFTDFSAVLLLFSAPFGAAVGPGGLWVCAGLEVHSTFFTDFLTIFDFNQRKSSSPLTKTEASFEYLNHTRDPAFAVHPCPSPIFCHQEDKSELRGATPHFLPRLSPKPAQEWLPANFTVHSDFSSTISAIRLLSPATSVIGGFLHRQSRMHYWLYLCHTSCHTDTP